MKISPTLVRVAMICSVIYGIVIALIQLGLVSSGEHSMILLYWLLMPGIWILQKMSAGVLEKTPLYFIAGINVLVFFSVIFGATKAVEAIRKKEPNQSSQPTRSARG